MNRSKVRIALAAAAVPTFVAIAEATALLRAGWWLAFVRRAEMVCEFGLRLVHEIVPAAWPLSALVLGRVFQPELRELIRRVRKGPGGSEFADTTAFTVALATLPEPPSTATVPLPPLTPSPSTLVARPGEKVDVRVTASLQTNVAPAPRPLASDDDVFQEIVSETDDLAPELAITALAIQIERELKRIVAASGLYPPHGRPGFSALLKALQKLLPEGVYALARAFAQVRNEVVHGKRIAMSKALDVVQAGRDLLRYLEEDPNKPPVVVAGSIPVFRDQMATELYTACKAVLLRYPNGAEAILATTRTYDTPGVEIAWEWSMNRTFDEAFYRHPVTGVIAVAWSSSAEFVGRPLSEL